MAAIFYGVEVKPGIKNHDFGRWSDAICTSSRCKPEADNCSFVRVNGQSARKLFLLSATEPEYITPIQSTTAL